MYDVVLVAPNGEVFCAARTPDPDEAEQLAQDRNAALHEVPWLHYEVHEEPVPRPGEALFSD